ncbi:MAG: branched-chain amino acid ABC transporter permease [Hyphomicrobiales bacterium]|nr:branched-chain amino acid ABC transporter permease [Hyphomicrobiales bacterium]
MITAERLRHLITFVTFAALIGFWSTTGYFGYELIAEITVFAILAMSLDLAAGYTGLVSLGHGALFGFGAYMFGLFTMKLGIAPGLGMPAAILATTVCALLVGMVVVRVHGIFFIMITLAIGEMGYEFFFKYRYLGGDDGLVGLPRLDLSSLGVTLSDPSVFALALIIVTFAVYLILAFLLRTPYGRVLNGIHENPQRMRALGFPIRSYRISAFALSGAVAGLAGTLTAQHTQFITPQLLHWTTSGEVLVMVILGGLGSLVGPIIGAAIVTLLRHELSTYTDYWGFWLGVFLIIVVVSRKDGIVGWLDYIRQRIAEWRRPEAAEDA